MATLLRKAASTLRRRFKPRTLVRVDDPMELAALSYWADKKPLRIQVPADMLRMQGAFVYGPAHPFVDALNNGRAALAAFYDRLQPQTVAQYYGLERGDRQGADLPPWELPWYLRAARTPPPGELSLGAHHGVSFYHLGHTHIPVSFRQGFPRLIDPVQAQLWPLVRSGDMDIGVAQEILQAYTSATAKRTRAHEPTS